MSEPSGDDDQAENNDHNSLDPEDDVRRLVPALSTFLTSDEFLRQLVATCMDQAKADLAPSTSQLAPPPLGRQPSDDHSRQLTGPASTSQSSASGVVPAQQPAASTSQDGALSQPD